MSSLFDIKQKASISIIVLSCELFLFAMLP